jgi:hypothetical protein
MNENAPASNSALAALDQPTPAGVTVVPRNGNEIPHPNCLVVEPFRDAAHGDRLLANVEHYLEIENPTGFPWRIVPVNNEPLSLTDAMELAMAYATKQAVPVIVVNHDGMSSDSERQQTDTAILDLRSPPKTG